MDDIRSRLATTERNQSDLAKSISEIVGSLSDTRDDVARLKTAEAVNIAREEAHAEWRKRTEAKLDGIYRLGWWVLTTFGSLTLAALASLLYGGGGNGP